MGTPANTQFERYSKRNRDITCEKAADKYKLLRKLHVSTGKKATLSKKCYLLGWDAEVTRTLFAAAWHSISL